MAGTVLQQRAFWVAGLPRSRTAWFAKATTGPVSACTHELTAHASDFAHFKALWLDGPEPYRGNADSACGLHIARIMDEIAPRTLIVERPIGEVAASCRRVLGAPVPGLMGALEQLQDALAYDHPLIKRVRFHDLTDRDALIEAVEWLVPGRGQAAAELARVNIQVSAAYAQGLSTRAHSRWHMKEAA